ncbi:hypothetical protein Sjap_024972 [Stephania japonica]|uniref:Homeobox protein n=1 Tax=Stephania japonica TaxID=461633 RepID=A0AAP0EEB3_9MAGN
MKQCTGCNSSSESHNIDGACIPWKSNQVSNWFINARVRLWKPMVESKMRKQRMKNRMAWMRRQARMVQDINHEANQCTDRRLTECRRVI